ncbi:CHAT domain-containing protein [Iningainema tapete]|nr:CHAT domain-containing protein [Iningainema tapete]
MLENSGFLAAGATTVVSSLWKVSDISTTFLMIKFYENLRQISPQEPGAVAVALKVAQKWISFTLLNYIKGGDRI